MPITSRAATRLHTVSAYVPHVLRMPIEHQERIARSPLARRFDVTSCYLQWRAALIYVSVAFSPH